MKHKVVHLTSVHVPYDTRIFYKECKSLVEKGYRVTLIAQHNRQETIEGIEIHPIPVIKSKFSRLINGPLNVYKAALKHTDASLFHFHDPELISVGLLLKRKGFKVVYDVHEHVPLQILSKEWVPRMFRKPLSWFIKHLEKIAARRFDHIITTVPAIQKRFRNIHCTMICNFPKTKNINTEPIIPYHERPFWVTYIGEINLEYGIHEMLDAIQMVSQKHDLTFILGGRITPDRLNVELHRKSIWQNVDYKGWVHQLEFKNILNHSRLGLVTIKTTPDHLIAYPTKLLEYLMYGLPVIVSDIPFSRKIIEATNCGIIVNPDKTVETANAVFWILDHPDEAKEMGKRGQKYVLEHLTWENEQRKLYEVYRNLLE